MLPITPRKPADWKTSSGEVRHALDWERFPPAGLAELPIEHHSGVPGDLTARGPFGHPAPRKVAMSAEAKQDSQLRIGHVLFIDIVGYSKLLTDQQRQLQGLLNDVVRSTEQFRVAEKADLLVCLPTGDGMALAFFTSPDAPVRGAMEIDQRLKEYPQLNVRMGIHSGPVDVVRDVNDRTNVAGAGINMAQRVMDCGDAGHILLSKRVADDLAQYERWQPHLYDLGACEVKHGVTIEVVSLYDGQAGNPEPPAKFKRIQQEHAIESRGEIKRRRKLILTFFGALFLVVVLAVGWFGMQRRAGERAVTEKSIAVLPFKPLVPAQRDQILEMGMADTLITKLSSSGEIIVPSFASVRPFEGLEQDARAAGRRLGVHAVLEGNVQKAGERLRVSVRLIRVDSGASLWSKTFDEKFTDVFAVQDAIAAKVAEALALRLTSAQEKRMTRRYTENVAAYELYLNGRYHWNKLIPPEVMKSIGFFQQALQLDPEYALAHFGLAEAYMVLAITSDIPANEVYPKAKAAATKALQIDESLGQVHGSLAMIHMWFDWDWAAAEREGRRAVQLNPNIAAGYRSLSHVHSNLGRHEEAIAEAARARELDPASLIINAREGATYAAARRHREARECLQKTLELDPNFWVALLFLGELELQEGRFPEAIAALTRAKEASRGNSLVISRIGCTWAAAGDADKARGALEELRSLSTQRYVPSSNLAALHLVLGEKDEAINHLEKALGERDTRLTFLRIDPVWDALRGEPRFTSISEQVGLR